MREFKSIVLLIVLLLVTAPAWGSQSGPNEVLLGLEVIGALSQDVSCEAGLVYEFVHGISGEITDTITVSTPNRNASMIYRYESQRGIIEGEFDPDTWDFNALRSTNADGDLVDIPVPSPEVLHHTADSLSETFAEERSEGEGRGFVYGRRIVEGVEFKTEAGTFICRHHVYTFRLPEDLGGEEMVLLEFWVSPEVPKLVPPQMTNTLSMYVTGTLETPWHKALQGGLVAFETQSMRFRLLRSCSPSR
jgi:hypothetical protein